MLLDVLMHETSIRPHASATSLGRLASVSLRKRKK